MKLAIHSAKLPVLAAGLLAATLLPTLRAQSMAEMDTFQDSHTQGPNRPFAVVVNGSIHFLQSHSGYAGSLVKYVQHHTGGTFVVFEEKNTLHRIDDPATVKQIRDFYAPMQALEAQQKALARAQRPLADTQRTLAGQQRAATSPTDQGNIGQAQGTVGQDQGSIGAQQGEIGRQQGEVARAAYTRVQGIIDHCLAAGTCPKVTS